MRFIVVSDIHIGSRYFMHTHFDNFLQNLPGDCELILNGDVIDNVYAKLAPSHQQVLNRIKRISIKQNVIWVRGNHDNGYVPNNFGNVRLLARNHEHFPSTRTP